MPPHGKTYYYLVLVLTLLFATTFAWGVFHWSAPLASSLFGLGLIIVLLVGALQALERLFRPVEANRRSHSFSASARRRIRNICNVVGAMSIAGLIAGFPFRIGGSDLQILSWLLFYIGLCLADLIGQPFLQPWGA